MKTKSVDRYVIADSIRRCKVRILALARPKTIATSVGPASSGGVAASVSALRNARGLTTIDKTACGDHPSRHWLGLRSPASNAAQYFGQLIAGVLRRSVAPMPVNTRGNTADRRKSLALLLRWRVLLAASFSRPVAAGFGSALVNVSRSKTVVG